MSVAPHSTAGTARGVGGVASPAPSRSLARFVRRPELGALVGLVIVFAFFSVTGTNGFLTLDGTASWMNTASELGVLAIPVGLLMIAGEFDLSVGSVIGAASMTVAIASGFYELPLALSIAMALAGGAAVGLVNGLLVVKTGLPSFIVTIAALFIIAGLALGVSRGVTGTTTVSLVTSGFGHDLFAYKWKEFHASILWWLGIAAVAWWVLSKARFGNWILATGGDSLSARATGVPSGRVKVMLFVCTGFAAALVGVIQAITYEGGNVTYGQQFVFAAPMAVVIGGVLLTGGYGSAVGVLMGTMIYGIVQLGVFYTGWNTDWAQFVLGMLLLAAVLGNNYFRRLAMTAR